MPNSSSPDARNSQASLLLLDWWELNAEVTIYEVSDIKDGYKSAWTQAARNPPELNQVYVI
jgi:hypothetical protein